VRVTITSGADDALELASLRDWLSRDVDIASQATIRTIQTEPSGTMGGLDVVQIVLTHAMALGQLALAYAAWRKSRPSTPPLTIDVNGTIVIVRDASPETISRIVELAGRPVTED
jgi:hypothetical protein